MDVRWSTSKSNHRLNQESLLIGSHLDTVINAGKFDGALGVIWAWDLPK